MAEQRPPLSPHIQVYRPQLTSVLSITHRLTGVLLALALPGLVVWLIALAAGPEVYAYVQGLLSSLPGRGVLLLITFALFYHLCNGIRHLFWDAGRGFELHQIYASGWAVVVVSLGLTAATWLLAVIL